MENSMIKSLRKQKQVERLQGKFKFRGYNLLEHSYMVATLYIHVCKHEGLEANMNQIDAILKHDILETITLDLPYDIKHLNRKTEEAWSVIEDQSINNKAPNLIDYTDVEISMLFSPQEWIIFKVCDALDLWMFCKEEIRLGNTSRDMFNVINKCEQLICGKFSSVDEIMGDF